jgi:hypothetical protein
MLRISHCLGNRLIDGGKIVSPTHRPRYTPQKHYFSASVTHFCQRLSKPHGLVSLEGLGKLKKFIHLIGSPTGDLPACSIVPQRLRYRVPSHPRFCIAKSYIARDQFTMFNHCKKMQSDGSLCPLAVRLTRHGIQV